MASSSPIWEKLRPVLFFQCVYATSAKCTWITAIKITIKIRIWLNRFFTTSLHSSIDAIFIVLNWPLDSISLQVFCAMFSASNFSWACQTSNIGFTTSQTQYMTQKYNRCFGTSMKTISKNKAPTKIVRAARIGLKSSNSATRLNQHSEPRMRTPMSI